MNEKNLIVKRGLFIFDTANFTEIPECDKDYCAYIHNSEHSIEYNEICRDTSYNSDRKVLLMKPDGSICYCRCR